MTTNATTALWPEVWPFHDVSSGALIDANRFYGFGDAGSLWGSFEGYETREAAVAAIRGDYEYVEIGTLPENLGDYAVAVLSGREFVDRLYSIEPEYIAFLFDHGWWSNQTEADADAIRNEHFQIFLDNLKKKEASS